MKIIDERGKKKSIIETGDLVCVRGYEKYDCTIYIVACEKRADFPYLVIELDTMEVMDAYAEMENLAYDYELYARGSKVELVIKE